MDYRNLFSLFGSVPGFYGSQRLSAAGVMLDNLSYAEKRLEDEGVTEELQAALRRADILAQRGDA